MVPPHFPRFAAQLHKAPNELRYLVCLGVEREVPGVEDVDFYFRDILAITFRLANIEGEIVLARARKAAANGLYWHHQMREYDSSGF